MKTQVTKLFSVGVLLGTLALAGCGQKQEAQADNQTASTTNNTEVKKDIKIGTTVGDFGDMVKESIKPILEKKGYKVELVEFTDYVRPNHALADGDIDVNVFQHKPYLDQFKAQNHLDLIPIFQVPTAPLGIYAGKLKNLADIKDGSTVSVPNDPSNFARALVMLDQLGWLKLKPNIDPLTASKADIAENPHNIKLVELEAAQLPRSRSDVDFAVVNGNYVISSGMKLTDALYKEPSYAYINWGAIRTKDKDKPWVKDVIVAYSSPEFKEYSYKKFKGYKFPQAWGAQPSASAPASSQPEAK